ncbi:hypothetical protein LEP1GSC038_3201 [Leptospira weilii str. 2006001855]|uniref:Uncharacterized protein n=1 Tax=Leptospira weilii str. 2006001855 TaxID=996804 RepID=M6FN19_9LEPT|nr:hypothetical protein LEP1GSC038_3201 [Leptospira weilii str. 2006001855]
MYSKHEANPLASILPRFYRIADFISDYKTFYCYEILQKRAFVLIQFEIGSA